MLSGEKLARYRRAKGLSQTEIAKRMRVTSNYISMLENEKQDIPQHIYDKWIDALNGKSVAEEVQDIEKEVKNNRKKPSKEQL